MIWEKERGEQTERKNLSIMCMAGKLQIKQLRALCTDFRLMFEENGKLLV
ncbi:MAG: hypothetical protein JRJ02_10220 [Deltaproteobacteria bacterium]|nr:hypothetical protein [Deltaproteobacteria bacterium]